MLAKGSGRVTTVIVAVNGIKGICKKEYIIYEFQLQLVETT